LALINFVDLLWKIFAGMGCVYRYEYRDELAHSVNERFALKYRERGRSSMSSRVIAWIAGRSQSGQLRGAANVTLIVCAYILAYSTLDRLSLLQEIPSVRFTLWNPPPACSLVLLLTKGLRYAPALFVAGVLTDRLIDGFPLGLGATFVTESVITLGYFVIAASLRRASCDGRNFDGVGAVILLLGILGVGVFGIAGLVGMILVAMRELPSDQLFATVQHFWIGDFTGLVGLLPALMTAPVAWRRWKDLPSRSRLVDLAAFAVGLTLALWTIFGVATAKEHQFFYLLLLPVVWISVRHGLPWCSMAVLAEQFALISVVTVVGYSTTDFLMFQVLSLVIAMTGLMLGAVVTERQHAEMHLRYQQAELERMTRLTTAGALGSAIAHEVSQPLATIATYAHACRRLLKLQSEMLAPTLEKLEREALRAGEIIDRLRDFLSKGEARFLPLDLVELARRIAAALAEEAYLRGVVISVDAQFVPRVSADRIQMEQVFVNLVRNGIDAAAEGPGNEKRVRVLIHHCPGAVQIEVEDSGRGVLPDIAERLFEPFETSKPRGMGLGLLLCRRLIEGHGGRLWWDQTFLKGARFVIQIPCEDEIA
jgi:two-component system, LuxR family, sensor kinase FixL